MKRAAKVAALAALGWISAHAQELPQDPEPGSFDVEPPLLPGNLKPEQVVSNQPDNNDIGDLERKLARAREASRGAERLFKIGALAKLEVENRAMRVVKLEAQLTQARLASAQIELEQKEQQYRAGEIAEAEMAPARLQAAQARQLAEAASARLKQAELDAAALNVERRQKLLAMGSGGKSALRRAEEKLAELRRNSQ